MNKFYSLNIIIQWGLALLLLVLGFGALMLFTKQFDDFMIIPMFFVLAPVLQFCMTPFLKLIGAYKYLSPMLLVFSPSKEKYDLHNGTSFDYLFVMRGIKTGKAQRDQLLSYYLDGLLEIISQIQKGNLPESIQIRGSSYFFSERTAKRLGFQTKATSFFEKFNLVLNYIDLVWMYSTSHGRLRFPNLMNTKTAETTGAKLVLQKDNILMLRKFITRNKKKVH